MTNYYVYIKETRINQFVVDADNCEEAKELAEEDFLKESEPLDFDVDDYEIINVKECTDMEFSTDEDFVKIRVPAHLKQEFKIFCAKKNKTMQGVLNTMIKNSIKDDKQIENTW